MYPIDLTQLSDRVKLEITKGDLEAFAQALLKQAQSRTDESGKLKEILTIDEAAEFIGLAKQTLYSFTSQRTIPHFKRGKGVRFRRTDLEIWMLENRRKTRNEIKSEIKSYKKP
jgi:excisionase family DNA binding protein